MSLVKRIVGPDESLIGIARLHWIYGVKGLTWLVAFIVLGGFLDTVFTSFFGSVGLASALPGFIVLGNTLFWICLTIGTSLFVLYFLMMIATEIGLTTKRLIYKKGLIFVDVKEVDLEEIKGADVDNEMLGRFFNYGSVHLDSRFVRDMILPSIADPYRFLKALNEARSDLKDESMHIVLDGHHSNDKVQQAMQQEMSAEAPSDKEEAPTPKMHDKKYDTLSENPMESMGEVLAETVESTDKVLNHYKNQKAKVEKDENLAYLEKKGEELEVSFEESATETHH